MAKEELGMLVEEFFLPIKHDTAWNIYAADAVVVYLFTQFLDSLQEIIDTFILNGFAKAVTSAMFALARTIHAPISEGTLEINAQEIGRYSADDHWGIAYVLQMKRLMGGHRATKEELSRYLEYRDEFIVMITASSKRFGAHLSELGIEDSDLLGEVLQELGHTQLFIPRALYKIPQFMDVVRRDGRKDCLGRSVSHVACDAGLFHLPIPVEELNSTDYLARSIHHIAVTHGAYELLENIDPQRILKSEALGVTLLEAAAMRGQLRVFEIVRADGATMESMLKTPSYYDDRNCLHWAASCGQAELLAYLLAEDWGCKDEDVMARDFSDDTPLDLAIRYGHNQSVEVLIKHINWERLNRLELNVEPFFTAVAARSLDIMKLLEPFCDVDKAQDGLTPLAEAARIGFEGGLEYLLGLNSPEWMRVDLDSVNRYRDETLKTDVTKTPLEIAMDNEHTRCVQILEEHGLLILAQLNARDIGF